MRRFNTMLTVCNWYTIILVRTFCVNVLIRVILLQFAMAVQKTTCFSFSIWIGFWINSCGKAEGISVRSNALIRISLMSLSKSFIRLASSTPFNLGILKSVRTNRYFKWSDEIDSRATIGSVNTFTTKPFVDNASLNRKAMSCSSSTMPMQLRSAEEIKNHPSTISMIDNQ